MGRTDRTLAGGTAPRRRGARMLRTALVYLALLAVAGFTLLPLAWAVSASFMTQDAIFKYTVPFSWHAFWPDPFTLASYRDLATGPFLRSVGNTLLVCAATVIGGIAVNSLGGFAFAAFEFRGKRLLFALVMVTFMVPFEVVAIPLFSIVTSLHLDHSYQTLILPALANGVVVFLFRQFFSDLPRELMETARVDGLTWFGVYWRIVLPLSTPVIVSAGLGLFLAQWESFFWPLLVANDPRYEMVQVALSNFHTEHIQLWNDQLAGSVITSLVPAVLLLCLQRYYVHSLAGTGSKE